MQLVLPRFVLVRPSAQGVPAMRMRELQRNLQGDRCRDKSDTMHSPELFWGQERSPPPQVAERMRMRSSPRELLRLWSGRVRRVQAHKLQPQQFGCAVGVCATFA